MKKLLFISPHLSTGGLPQVALKKIENLVNSYEVLVIEYKDISAGLFTVQKDKIKSILDGEHFITLSDNKNDLFKIIKKFNPDYIHLEEIPESFMSVDIIKKLYDSDRNYFITETTHDVNFNVNNKKVLPDKFMHVSGYIANKFSVLNVPYEVIEYPIEKKERPNRKEKLKELGLDPEYKHVLNVGLFTPGKNQKQVIEIAKMLEDEKIQFHFVGNQAGNFQEYWEPLMKDLPKNCIVWGERSDVDNFYSCMDLFLFTSTYELNPIVIKEALSYDMQILMYNLEPYDGVYDNNPNIQFLGNNSLDTINMIKDVLFNNIEYQKDVEYLKKNLLSGLKILPERCYITHTTKNYRETTFGLLRSLLAYSEYPVIVFTINFNIDEVENIFKSNHKIHFIEYQDSNSTDEAKILETEYGKYVDRSYDSTYKILTMKSKVLLKAFELGIKDGVYLDSDSVARYNIDDLMNEITNVKNYPLLTRGVYDIMLDENGKGDIERPLMDYLGVKERSMHYVQSNIVVFTDKCKNFIEEWKDVCEDKTILKNFEKWAPYQDETIINVLLWKHGYDNHLQMYHFNIRSPRFVEEFEKFDDSDKTKYSDQMNGFPFFLDGKQVEWSYIPYHKENVKILHGIKKYEEMVDIIRYQNRPKNDFCIIQTCDSNYKELANITFENNKNYADKHGYDYIAYTENINKYKISYWQKYIALKRHIRNYKWVFFLDADCMIMNYNIKLEDLIDDKYVMIMENMGDSVDINNKTNSKYVDNNFNVISSAMLFKNEIISRDFLADVYHNKVNCDCTPPFLDNSSVRCTLGTNELYKKYTKVFDIDSKKLNSMWISNRPSFVFNDGPKWNDNGNIFELGDFILHLAGYEIGDRISLAKQFLKYVIGDNDEK